MGGTVTEGEKRGREKRRCWLWQGRTQHAIQNLPRRCTDTECCRQLWTGTDNPGPHRSPFLMQLFFQWIRDVSGR